LKVSLMSAEELLITTWGDKWYLGNCLIHLLGYGTMPPNNYTFSSRSELSIWHQGVVEDNAICNTLVQAEIFKVNKKVTGDSKRSFYYAPGEHHTMLGANRLTPQEHRIGANISDSE
jgi:hypothetical protein